MSRPTAVTTATSTAIHDSWATMSATDNRAQPGPSPKPDSLRFCARHRLDRTPGSRASASCCGSSVLTSLPPSWHRCWSLGAPELPSVLARLVELELLRGFWSAERPPPTGSLHLRPDPGDADRRRAPRLAWWLPDRPPDLPSSPPIHELATLDLFFASEFLRHGDPLLRGSSRGFLGEGLRVFGGFLRPDALAGIRVGDRAIALFVERDLGTERGEVLAEKIRRYRSVFAPMPDLPVILRYRGWTPSAERGPCAELARCCRGGPEIRADLLTGGRRAVPRDPLGAAWTDGSLQQQPRSTHTVSADLVADPDARRPVGRRGHRSAR